MAQYTLDPELKLRPSSDLVQMLYSEDAAQIISDNEFLDISHLRRLRNIMKIKKSPENEAKLETGRKRSKESIDESNESSKAVKLRAVHHFHELVSGCELLLPRPSFPERSAELEARVQKLKREAENREYERMTKGLSNTKRQMHQAEQPIAEQLREVNKYLLVVVQFVLTAVSGFVSGYIAPYYLVGLEDVGIRLICGVLTFFLVAIADLYFVIRFFLAVDGVIQNNEEHKKRS